MDVILVRGFLWRTHCQLDSPAWLLQATVLSARGLCGGGAEGQREARGRRAEGRRAAEGLAGRIEGDAPGGYSGWEGNEGVRD